MGIERLRACLRVSGREKDLPCGMSPPAGSHLRAALTGLGALLVDIYLY
jgi:hypothetical protein